MRRTILDRFIARVCARDWLAVVIDIIIVIVGVFIGTEVSNWNQHRIEKRQTARLLEQIKPELKDNLTFYAAVTDYYSVARNYAAIALKGWNGDASVSDEAFVVAAYQASQIYGGGTNRDTWATIFGSDQIRLIGDADLRGALVQVLAFDYDAIDWMKLATRYRENVRRVLPDSVQSPIRRFCNDQATNQKLIYTLPPKCDAHLPKALAETAAARLRARIELAEDLHWHLAEVSTFLGNIEIARAATRKLYEEIEGD